MTIFNPTEALKSGVYVSATTGHGKSDLAMNHADQLIKEGVTVVVFDATMDWIKRSSIPHYVTVQLEQYFQYSLDVGSLIFDMSLLNAEQQKRLVKMVCTEIWRHQVEKARRDELDPENPKDWIYIVFEEGHIYFPQGCMRSKDYAEMVQIATGGRNYNIRFEIVVQFASMVDKDVMKYMRQRYFGYTDEPNDQNYVTNFLGTNRQRESYEQKLMNLKAGEFLYKHGREVKPIYNPIYEGDGAKPLPPLVPSMQVEAIGEEETTEPAKPDWLRLAQMGLQIGSLLVFLFVVFLAFISYM